MALPEKPILILIQSTDSPIELHLEKGIWDRQYFSLAQYAMEFKVFYYTSDLKNYQEIMPTGVIHKASPVIIRAFGVRHVLYYFFLLLSSFTWRHRKNAIIRVIGVNVPVVPLLKFISKRKTIISYQFDWAKGMKLDQKGIKPLVSFWVQKRVIRAADHLICTTQWLKDIALDRYAFAEKKITIIPNYVNTLVFQPRLPKKKQIVFAGRLHWSKGVDTLIYAFNKFVLDQPEYKLIIMGTGEEQNALAKLVQNKNVVFTGGIGNLKVAEYFNESEIFVLPTVTMEGHAKALVEAMASGCKCITSDVPGNNHVLIESNSADLLFPPRMENALYEKLKYAIHVSADNQYQYALHNYSSTACFEREFEIFKGFL